MKNIKIQFKINLLYIILAACGLALFILDRELAIQYINQVIDFAHNYFLFWI